MVADIRDRRRGVMIMPPPRPRAFAPQPQPQREAQAQPSNMWELGAKMAAEGAQGQSQDDGGGGFGRGLGFLVNNPVTQNLLKPLEVLDYGRRASVLGVESAAQLLPQEVENALALVGVGLPILAVDEAKSDADERSAWEKMRDPTYGWGQVGHTTGNKWIDRGIGLTGDVALDPLTYLTFGAAPLAKGAPTIGRAARFSRMGEAADTLRAAGKLDDAAIQALRKVGERGYGAADEEMLRLLGLQRSGARLTVPFTRKQTGRIPLTGGAARGINATTGAMRGAFNRSNRMQSLIRAPKELENATEVLTRASRGSQDDFLAALTDVQWDNIARSGAGFFRGMGSQELKQRSGAIRQELEDTFGGDLNEYLRVTELDPTRPTQLNALSARMREIAAERGVEIPELEGMGYLPHVLSPEFRQLLHDGGSRVDEFMKQTGIVMNDTLRESGFLQKRALRPDVGTTMRIEIGDKTIELKTGSIPEINEKVAELFPELKTTALETDPMTMFERYIPATAHDVGNREAIKTLTERGNPFVRIRTDPRYETKVALRDELQTRLARVERQIIMEGEDAELLRERRIVREQLKVAEAEVKAAEHRVYRGGTKPFEDDELFKPALQVDRTRAANEQIYKQATETAGSERQAADLIREGDRHEDIVGLVDELTAYRSELRAPMSARARRIPGRIQRLQDAIDDITSKGRSVAWQKRRVRALAQQTAAEVQAEIDNLTDEIATLPGRLRAAGRAEQQAFIEMTRQRMNALQAEGEHLRDMLTTEMMSEIEPLTRGLADAQRALDAAMEPYRLGFPEGMAPPPPAEPGMVRLYRGEPRGEQFGGPSGNLPDWIAQSPEMQARRSVQGRWFTEDQYLANRYPANMEPDELSRLAYVDIPEEEYRRIAGLADQPEGVRALSAMPGREVVLPEQYMGQVKRWDPEGLVARAEATPPTTGAPNQQMNLLAGAGTADIGSRPLTGAMESEPLYGGARGVDPEAAEQAAKFQKAQREAAEAEAKVKELREIVDRPEYIQMVREDVAQKLAAMAAKGDPDEVRKLRDQLQRLTDELPRAKARIRAEKIRSKLQRADVRAKRLRAKADAIEHPRIPQEGQRGLPPEIQQLRHEVEQQTWMQERNPRLQMLYDLRKQMSNPDAAIRRRANAVAAQLPAAQQEWLAGLRGEGVVGHIGAETEREITSQVTSATARKTQLEQALTEIPEDLRREIADIQAQQDALKQYANELATEQGALLNERAQLRTALEATSVGVRERTGAATRARTRPLTALSPELIETQPLNRAINDIEEMIHLNPGATDQSLNVAEAQLQMYRRQLEQAAQHDLKANQALDVAAAAKDQTFVRVYTAMLKDGWKEIPGVDNVYVRSELRRMLQNAEQAIAQPGLFGSTVQALTNFFKTYATLSPGFHVRNALSATFMNTTDGVALRNQLRGVNVWRDFVKADDPLTFYQNLTPRWQQAFDAVFATGAGGRFFESGVAEATAIGRTRLKEGIFRNKATILSQRAGQRVEGSVRLGMAFDTLKNGGSVEDAINRITRVHFDYSQVSKFDENMKRLIPFWTFMSRNLPLQFTQMWMKPKVYNWYKSFVRNFSEPADEFTPEYITEGGGFNTGMTTPDVSGVPVIGGMMSAGMPIFANPDFSQNRYEGDVERLTGALSGENWSQILSDFNPYLTAPIEYATDRDLFTGRTYQPDDWRKASGITDMAMLPLMALTGQTQRGANGDIMYQEKGVDAYRSMIPILDRISRLAPGTAGGESSDRQLESILRFLGMPVRTISEDQMQNERRSRVFDAREQQRLQRVLAGG